MPALSFKKQFRPMVEAGTKRHSIRGKRSRAWKVGDKLALYTGMRTKFCSLIFRTVVTKVEDITITVTTFGGFRQRLAITLDGNPLSNDEVEALASADGFADATEMMAFWWENNTLPFHGDVIHWNYPGVS